MKAREVTAASNCKNLNSSLFIAKTYAIIVLNFYFYFLPALLRYD